MLCPSCLNQVKEFVKVSEPNRPDSYKCPSCADQIPTRYKTDYTTHPPVTVFVIAPNGHGKTMFFGSLFMALERIGRIWEDFSYTPSGETGIKQVRTVQQEMEKGITPQPVKELFKKPSTTRMVNVPDRGNCQLLMFDGRVGDPTDILREKYYNNYIKNTKIVTFLISLEDLSSSSDLTDILTWYLEEVSRLKGNTKEQTFALILTNCEKMTGSNELPLVIKEYLESEDVVDIEQIKQTSQDCDNWLGSNGIYISCQRRSDTR